MSRVSSENPVENETYEGGDFHLSAAIAILAVVAFLILSALALSRGVSAYYGAARRKAEVRPFFVEAPPPPAPRLQQSPRSELAAFRREEETILNSYGWIDPKAGVVRVPVSVAEDLVLRDGLPARESK